MTLEPPSEKPASAGVDDPIRSETGRQRVLLVEDNLADARLIEEALKEGGASFDLSTVTSLEAAQARLREDEPFEACLLDLSLPDSQGLETFRSLKAEWPELPFVILTGLEDESMALAAVHEGAQDYLVKGELAPASFARALRHGMERGRLRSELARVRAREQAQFEEMDQLKSDMIAFVSHEFHQTLSAIDGEAQSLLLRGPATAKPIARRVLSLIDSARERLTRLIDSFMEIAGGGQPAAVDLIRGPCDVGKLVEEAVALVKAASGKCEFAADVDEAVGTIQADREKLCQVLVNLLSHAEFYGPRGSVVEVRASRESGEVRFEVTNLGIAPSKGAPAADAGRPPGEKGERPRGGGLYLSRCLVEAHGGKLRVVPKKNGTTVISFSLPG